MSKYLNIKWKDVVGSVPLRETFLAFIASLQNQINGKQDKITDTSSLTLNEIKSNKTSLSTSDNKQIDLTATNSQLLTIKNNDSKDTVIRGVGAPTSDNDATNKKYVDGKVEALGHILEGVTIYDAGGKTYTWLGGGQGKLTLQTVEEYA